MLKINEARLLQDLHDLAQIGATPDGGVTRKAFSERDVEAREWLKQRILADQFKYHEDGAGNQSAILPSTDPQATQTLISGSHIDSVTNGGRFDGVLGILSALEVLRTLREAGLSRPVHLEAISFTDEEGHLLGEFGSLAFAGMLTPEKLANPRGGLKKLQEGMQRLGLSADSVASAKRDPASIAGYIELHVEQGARLEESNTDIGVVTAIVGIRSAWLTFHGRTAHAGTKPMHQRADALWGATDFMQQARQLIIDQFTPGVMNCGFIDAQPGSFNIVPAQVKLALEFRHRSEELLDEMQQQLFTLAQTAADQRNLTITIEPAINIPAAPMCETVITAIENAAESLDLKHKQLLSFAGHDAQTITQICPAAMIFVPSVDGISHNPKEYTKDQDVINGANTLLHTVLELIKRTSDE